MTTATESATDTSTTSADLQSFDEIQKEATEKQDVRATTSNTPLESTRAGEVEGKSLKKRGIVDRKKG